MRSKSGIPYQAVFIENGDAKLFQSYVEETV